MKRIYKNNDLAFNLTINNFPINIELIESIEFRFYTINQSNYILKTQADINMYNQVLLSWDELKTLEEGVLYYDYTIKIKNDEMNDGTQDTVNKVMTNYFICTGTDNINIDNNNGGGNNVMDVDLSNYYTKAQVDSMIPSTEGFITEIPSEYVTDSELTAKGYLTEHQSLDDYAKLTDIPSLDGYSLTSHTHEDYISSIPSEYITESELNDKGYLTQHQSLDDYYTKTEVDNKINASGNFDSTQYYTKSEVDAKIPTDYITSIPSEYITETELNDKGYLTQHQSLTNYYTKSEIDEKIPSDYIKAVNVGRNDDENFQVEDGVVNIYTEFYDGGYDMNIDSRSVFGIKPMDDTITLENVGGTGNGNFRCGIKINDNVINRISALESELTGVSEQITELNNMVV